MSLSVRLTLWYTLLSGLAVASAGLLIYQQAEQRAYHDLDALLSNRAASVLLGKDLLAGASSPPGPLRLPAVTALGADGVAIEVLSARLILLAATNLPASTSIDTTVAHLSASPVPWDREAARLILAHPWTHDGQPASIYSTRSYDGQTVRIYTTINALSGTMQIIQTARSEEGLQQSLVQLGQTLLGAGLLMLALVLGGGLVLTWRALAPVRQLTQAARQISASQDFSRRVPLHRNARPDQITELATTFNSMLAALDRAYQQQKRFIADASHELRAPITSIRCNLDLLARAPDIPADERGATLADARSEADRMGRLVNDLLTLARRDETHSGGSAVGAEEQPVVDLDSLLLEVFRQYRANRPAHSAARLILHHIAPVRIVAREDQVKQILVALLDNALKYTPAVGTITLTLEVENLQAMLTISDTGIGIASADLPHIFERFYRADRARSREQGGSGLGLAIVQSMVHALHGQIAVQSVPGEGSTFLVSLPCLPREQA